MKKILTSDDEQKIYEDMSKLGGGITDVKINDTSIVTDGVANIPIVSETDTYIGLVKLYPSDYKNGAMGSLKWDTAGPRKGCLSVNTATQQSIDKRWNNPIGGDMVAYAVKSAMSSTTDEAWTQDEKAMARSRMGMEWRYIGKVETTEEVVKIIIDKDVNGNDLDLKEVYLKTTIIGTETNSAIDNLRINVNSEVDTAYRICDFADGVQNTSSKKRQLLLHIHTLFNTVVGTTTLSVSSGDFNTSNPNLCCTRVPPKEINAITSITVYPKTSGIVFGVGSTLEIYGR